MPNYDFQCCQCDYVLKDVFLRLNEYQDFIIRDCPTHGSVHFSQVLSMPAIEDWGNEGPEGRYFEHLSPAGMRFRDKKSYQEHLRKNGLVEWAPHK